MEKTKVSPEQVDQTKTRRRIEDTLRKDATPEKLIKIAEILGVEVATIPKVLPCGVSGRPYYGPNQVRCVHQIKQGLKYYTVNMVHPYRQAVVVVREPYFKKDSWWIGIKHLKGNWEEDISLQDHSVLPYNHGEWNKHNFLVFSSESRYLACACCHHHCCYCHCSCHHCC